VVSVTPRPLYSRERDIVLILQEAEWGSGPVCMGLETFPPVEFEPGPSSPWLVAILTELFVTFRAVDR